MDWFAFFSTLESQNKWTLRSADANFRWTIEVDVNIADKLLSLQRSGFNVQEKRLMSLVDVLKSLIQLHYLFQLPWRSMMIIRIYFSFFSYNRCNPSLTLIHSTVQRSNGQRSCIFGNKRNWSLMTILDLCSLFQNVRKEILSTGMGPATRHVHHYISDKNS